MSEDDDAPEHSPEERDIDDVTVGSDPTETGVPKDVIEDLPEEAQRSIVDDDGGAGGVFDGMDAPESGDTPIEREQIDAENALFVLLGVLLTVALFWRLAAVVV